MITTLLTAWKARLDAQDYFSDPAGNRPILVIVENVGEISAEIQHRVESLGLAVLLTTPDFANPQPDRPKVISQVDLVAQITEDVMLNQATAGTQKKAIDVAEEVIKHSHFFQTGSFTRLEFQNVQRQNDVPLILHVNFKTRFAITPAGL